jgi:hypothetical protein
MQNITLDWKQSDYSLCPHFLGLYTQEGQSRVSRPYCVKFKPQKNLPEIGGGVRMENRDHPKLYFITKLSLGWLEFLVNLIGLIIRR